MSATYLNDAFDLKYSQNTYNVIHCYNPRCITFIEQELPHIFYIQLHALLNKLHYRFQLLVRIKVAVRLLHDKHKHLVTIIRHRNGFCKNAIYSSR